MSSIVNLCFHKINNMNKIVIIIVFLLLKRNKLTYFNYVQT